MTQEKIDKIDFIKSKNLSFPGGSDCKASAYNVGDLGSIPGSGRSPGEGNGNPLQYSCLENPMDRGAWWATDHGVAKSWKWLSDFPWLCRSQQTGKFFKRWEYQTTLSASWEICVQVRKQLLELDMEQQTGSKSGKNTSKVCIVSLLV